MWLNHAFLFRFVMFFKDILVCSHFSFLAKLNKKNEQKPQFPFWAKNNHICGHFSYIRHFGFEMRIAICKNSFKEKLWSNQTNEKKFCIIYIHLWCEYIYVSSGEISARIALEKYRATKPKYRNKMEKTNQATITNQQVFCLLPKLYGILVYSAKKTTASK